MEAMTPESGSEGTSEVSSTEQGTVDAVSPSSVSEGTASADSYDVDLSDVPEEYRPYAKEYGEKHFKKFLTQYTQGKGAELTNTKTELDKLKKEREEIQQLATQMFQDENVYKQYRQQYGYSQPQTEPETNEIPKMETVEDFVAWNNAQRERERAADQAQYDQKLSQTVEQRLKQYDQDQRYHNAVHKLQSTDETFKNYEKFITSLAREDEQLKAMYTGVNEFEVLSAATVRFKEMMQPMLESAKTEAVNTLHTKKQSTTFVPQKTVGNTNSQGAKKSKEEIIAKLKASGLAY